MNKRGFTLIEIVLVLVLLGILAAVAVPKYFDLKSKAEQQTAKAVAAEYQSRINGKFAEEILQGKSCTQSKQLAIAEAQAMFPADVSEHKFTGLIDTPSLEVTPGVIELSLKNDADVFFGPFTIAVPVCAETE